MWPPRAAARGGGGCARRLPRAPPARALCLGGLALALAALLVREFDWCFAALQPGAPPGGCPAWLAAAYPPLPAGGAAAALGAARAAAAGDARPYHDVVLLVPTPAAWADRRRALRRAFARTAARLPAGASAALLFVVGARAAGAAPGALGGAAARAAAAALPDAGEGDVLAADCADLDGEGGWVWPVADSATTCKVIAGLQAAVARFRFGFLARVGDDAYFRFDAFLERVAPRHAAGSNLVFAWWMAGGEVRDTPGAAAAGGGGAGGGALAAALGGPPGFPLRHHAPYPGGMAYVLGENVTAALAAAADRVGLLDAAPEDLVVGLWLAGLGRARVARVHSPCFHNAATRVPSAHSLLGFPTRHWLAAECTPASLLVHYMTPELWDAVRDDGTLECGSTSCLW